MTAAALRLEAPADPVLAVAHRLCDFLQASETIDARLLRDLLASATGRSAADGGWSMRHAYDALELAQVLWLGSAGAGMDLSSPSVALDALIDLGRRLPTQTVRTEDQLVFQQFSTPAPIAWAMSVAAQLRSSDTVLEPSAGTGLLVWPAAKLGAALVLNEIEPGRRHCLELAFPQARISDHDGELVDDLLPVDVQADILLINPPFARSIGRPVDRHAAARHLQASLRRLKSCGRAVAIMPTWFDRQMLGSEATIRLDAVLPRGLYVKHGTGIAVRLLVLDKLPAADEGPAELEMPDLPALLDAIQHLPARARPSDPMPPTPRTRLSGRRLRGEVNEAVQAGLITRGEVGPGSVDLIALERVSVTDEELRRPQNYEQGMIVEIGRAQASQKLPRARAVVEAIDHRAGTVSLRLSGGKERTLRPEKLRIRAGESPLQLYQPKRLQLHEKDRIRWTANDHQRGLFNADQAKVLSIDEQQVLVETSRGQTVALPRNDPMLQRLDLAYALNAHMAQGLTSDRGIAVMETCDTKLVNQQTFLVTVTRLRDSLTLVVDNAVRLERQLARNAGGKTSALETSGKVRPASAEPARPPLRAAEPEKGLDLEPARTKPYDIGI